MTKAPAPLRNLQPGEHYQTSLLAGEPMLEGPGPWPDEVLMAWAEDLAVQAHDHAEALFGPTEVCQWGWYSFQTPGDRELLVEESREFSPAEAPLIERTWDSMEHPIVVVHVGITNGEKRKAARWN